LLKACALIMIKLLTSLFETCIQLFYHSKTFKEINTITLKKARKDDYITSKTYRLITFLNIMSKIMKSIMSRRIAWLTKTYRLLIDFHMRCRKNRSIESTLKLLTKQIYIVWNKNTNRIVILLNLDVIEAFDTISHERLIHDLRKRRISKWIIDWVISFLQNRTTILTWIAEWSLRSRCEQKLFRDSRCLSFFICFTMSICWRCAINSKSIRDFWDTQTMWTFWFTTKARMKIAEVWNEYTNSAKDERFDTNSCSLRLSTSWFTSSKIQRSLTWQSRSRSNRARYNRKSTYEFWRFRSTFVWNEIRTYEKFKKRW
jgi:hypothetical protein